MTDKETNRLIVEALNRFVLREIELCSEQKTYKQWGKQRL